MSAKQNMEAKKEEDTARDWWYDYGKLFGEGYNEIKDFFTSGWDQLKHVGTNFLDGFSRETTGKSYSQHMDAVSDRLTEGKHQALHIAKNLDDHLEELGISTTTPQTGSSAKPIVYSNWSPAAQQFGMDQQTAYAEHMANTAHQREVADLRAAGLNPVLGVGSGASGVSGHVATSGSSAQKSMNGDFIVDAIGATAAVVTAILTKNPAYGYMAGNAVNAVGDMFTSGKK